MTEGGETMSGRRVTSNVASDRSEQSDEAVLAGFGYKQELRRSLTPFELFGISFSTTSITTGLFLMVGPTLAIAGPLGLWLVPIVAIPTLAVAAAYAALARRVPIAGLEYQWGLRVAGRLGGLIAGWLGFAASLVGVVSVAYVLASTVLPALFSYTSSPVATTWVTIAVIAVLAVLLALSVKVPAAITKYATISEIVAVVGLTILLIVVGAIRGHLFGGGLIVSRGGVPSSGYFSAGGWKTVGTFWLALTVVFYGAGTSGWQNAGAAAEEGRDPARSVPRAMYLTVITVTVLEVVFLLALVLNVKPGSLQALGASPTAVADVMRGTLGAPLAKAFLVIVGFNIMTCALAIFLQATRYVFAMSRDGNFLGSRMLKLATVAKRRGTPLNATILCFVLIAIILGYFGTREGAYLNLIGAGGLSLVFAYLAGVTLYAVRGHRLPALVPERFGRGARWFMVAVAYAWLLFMLWVFHIPEFKNVWIYLAAMFGIGVVFVLGVLINPMNVNSRQTAEEQAGAQPV